MFKKARIPIKKLFTDKCTISKRDFIVNEYGISTYSDEVIIYDNIPCRISYSSIPSGEPTNDGETEITQNIKLFVSNDVIIPSGCKIAVTRNEQTILYTNSSQCALYDNHNEINLSLFKKWN